HYTVTVTVRDSANATDSATMAQIVHNPLTSGTPTRSSSVLHDDARDLVYVVNPDNGTLTAVSATGTPSKQWEVAVGAHPTSLAQADDGTLWVIGRDDASITLVDPDDQSTSSLALPHGSDPFGICFSPDGSVAYVTLHFSPSSGAPVGKLLAIDPTSTGSLAINDELELGPWAHAIAVSGDGARILVTRFISPAGEAQVWDVDASDLSLNDTIVLAHDPGLGGSEPDDEADARGVLNHLHGIAISPDGLTAWVTAKKDNTGRGANDSINDGRDLDFESTVRTVIAPIELATNTDLIDQRIDLNDSDSTHSIAFSPLGDWLFVSVQGNKRVDVFDAYLQQAVHSIDTQGVAPQGLTLGGDRLFVHNFMQRELRTFSIASILDASDTTATPVGGGVDLVANEQLGNDVLAGKQIFYNAVDPRMSRDAYLSCASCHFDGGSDGRIWDFTQRGEGLRKTISLRGRRGDTNGPVHWTANFDEVQDFENDIRLQNGGDGFLPDADWNDADIRDPLGTAKQGRSTELDQLADYVNSLDSIGTSPYRAANGDLTSAGQAGRLAFAKANCNDCHSGGDFSDSRFGLRHDVGTITGASGDRIGASLDGFDTPGLRGLWRNAPYLHDGSAASLDVVLDNDAHGDPELLSSQERSDLVAYLLQIDDNETAAPNNEPSIDGIAADPATVTATSTELSVAASDLDQDALDYSWSVESAPTGAAPSIQSSTSATTMVTFDRAGTYLFRATVDDGSASASDTIQVEVEATPTEVIITPTSATVSEQGERQFSATLEDQFERTMTASFSWTVLTGGVGGTVDGTGLYTAPVSSGSDTLRVSANGISADAAITVEPAVTLAFAAASASTAESAAEIAINLQRSGSSTDAVSVEVASTGGSASSGHDYTAVSQTVSWADGESADRSLTVTLGDDILAEDDETIILTLANASGAVIGSQSSMTITITDDGSDDAVDFAGLQSAGQITGYNGRQDGKPAAWSVEDGGATFHHSGDGWKQIPFSYTVSADTRLQFEYQGLHEGEIQGVGIAFSGDSRVGDVRPDTAQVWGSQSWGGLPVTTYEGSGNWVTVDVDLGSHISALGAIDRLILVNDDD
ncbi:MAG: Calx-beta domain-containing protein, partial [Planctomycetota bacterium]